MGIPGQLHASQKQTDKSLRYTIYQILWKTIYFSGKITLSSWLRGYPTKK